MKSAPKNRHETETALPSEQVLLLAPTGRDADLAADMLRDAGISAQVCRSASELLRQIDADCGPVVVAAEALSPKTVDHLETLLGKQPVWSDLPLIIFISGDGVPNRLQGLAGLRNSTLLHRPVKTVTFVSTVRAALQDRFRQFEMRDMIEQLQMRTRQMQRLTLELSGAEERERGRIALLLHDDLQQLLGGIHFQMQLLVRKCRGHEAGQKLQELTGIIKQAIEKTRDLSHRLSPPTLRQFGLVASLHWLADRMQDMYGLRVTVENDVEPGPFDLPIKYFLYRSAQEFLFNVAKHAGTDEARLSLSQSEIGYELCVRDRGCGFDAEALTRQSSSAGLGMLSIRERANYLGGSLRITSQPGHGCTALLFLPWNIADGLMEDSQLPGIPAAAEPSPKNDAPERSSRQIRVLLVDDHQVLRSGLTSLLSDLEQIEVIGEADNGAQAVELAEREQPEVILMDVAMPGMDGIEATRLIKTRYPAIRIIGLSMFNDEETAARMYEAGAEGYLTKAEAGEKLIDAIVGTAP